MHLHFSTKPSGSAVQIQQKVFEHTNKHSSCSPNSADMFWKILSSSGVTAGLFSKVTNLYDRNAQVEKRQILKLGQI